MSRNIQDKLCIWVLSVIGLGFVLFVALLASRSLEYNRTTAVIPENPAGICQESTTKYYPPTLKSLIVNQDSPTNYFDFLLDTGEVKFTDEGQLEPEVRDLINYFFLGITLPPDEFWVNLNPIQPEKIVSPRLGITDMGKVLLEADLQLKKDSARFTDPRTSTGKKYWQKLNENLQKQGLTTSQVPASTRVWIIPGKARIQRDEDKVTIVESRLKVCLESEYLSRQDNNFTANHGRAIEDCSSGAFKEIILPRLEEEVNFGKNYARLRQVYSSLILSRCYKQKYYNKKNFYSQSIHQARIVGLCSKDDWEKDKFFQAYLASHKQGEYCFTRQEYDPDYLNLISKRYFSGGIRLNLPEDLELEEVETVSSSVEGVPLEDKQGDLILVSAFTQDMSAHNRQDFARYWNPEIRFSSPVSSKKLLVAALMASQLLGTAPSTAQDIKGNLNKDSQIPADIKKHIIEYTKEGLIKLSPEGRSLLAERALSLFKMRVPEEFIAPLKKEPGKIKGLTGFQVVSDSHTQLEAVIFQVGDCRALDVAATLAGKLREDVRLIIITPNLFQAHSVLMRLKEQGIKSLEQRLRFIVTGVVSPWGRDPYIVLINPVTGKFTLLPILGDAGTKYDRMLGWEVMKYDLGWDAFVAHEVKDETLDMQGGDITADSKYVYVGGKTVHYSQYNRVSMKVLTEEQAIRRIQEVTGKEVIVLRGGKDIHNDRYHIPLGKTKYGEHTSLIIDPIQTLQIIASMTQKEKEQAIESILTAIEGKGLEEDINKEKLRDFFNVTRGKIKQLRNSKLVQGLERLKMDLETRGINVQRVPGLPAECVGNPFGIYPTNVIMDAFLNRSTGQMQPSVIIPQYNIGKLDAVIKDKYEELGFKVDSVDGIVLGYSHGGPRCLVQTVGFPSSSPLIERERKPAGIDLDLRKLELTGENETDPGAQGPEGGTTIPSGSVSSPAQDEFKDSLGEIDSIMQKADRNDLGRLLDLFLDPSIKDPNTLKNIASAVENIRADNKLSHRLVNDKQQPYTASFLPSLLVVPGFDKVLPRIRSIEGKIRIHDAGASTLKEAYSIIIAIEQDYCKNQSLWKYPDPLKRLEVIATDIEELALKQGENGVFTPSDFLNSRGDITLNKEDIREYFNIDSQEGTFIIKDSIRNKVTINHADLSEVKLEDIDLILFTFVSYQMTPEARKKAARNFNQQLKEGGCIIAAIWESEKDMFLDKGLSLRLVNEQELFQALNGDISIVCLLRKESLEPDPGAQGPEGGTTIPSGSVSSPAQDKPNSSLGGVDLGEIEVVEE